MKIERLSDRLLWQMTSDLEQLSILADRYAADPTFKEIVKLARFRLKLLRDVGSEVAEGH